MTTEQNGAIKLSNTRTILMAICIGGAYVDWGLIFSIQPSFYPSEAEDKGATPSQYGFVFGIVHLAAFITAPIFARYGSAIGPKLLYNLGGLAQGLACIGFGFLEYVDGTAAFLGLSYFIRAIDGVADAASWGAVIGILMELYPNKVASIMAWTEMAFGLGYTIGPAIGSFLYSAGGFKLPFFVVGGIGVFFAFGLFLTIPKIERKQNNNKSSNRRRIDGYEKVKLISSGSEDDIDIDHQEREEEVEQEKPLLTFNNVARTPSIFLPYIDNIICFCGIGMIESMLEPHMMASTGASHEQVGYNFLLMGLFYMVVTPICGHICDNIKHPVIVSLCGNLFMALGLVLIGPVPFFPLEPSVALTLTAGAIIGIGQAQLMVSTFSRAYNAAMKHGFSDDIGTYLILSGLWSASFYFGNFLGPTAAGFMVEKIGFRATSLAFVALEIKMFIINVIILGMELCKRRQDEYEQL